MSDARYSDFVPVKELQNVEADLSLFFLSSFAMQFIEPVDDPWFSAHQETFMDILVGPTKMYQQDRPAGVLGCTTQQQFCNPNLPDGRRCSPLRGVYDNIINGTDAVLDLWKDDADRARIRWFRDNVFLRGTTASIQDIVQVAGLTALSARNTLSAGVQSPLPPDQWMREVELWAAASLVSKQGAFQEVAGGPSSRQADKILVEPKDAVGRQICRSQVSHTRKKLATERYLC